MPAIHWPMDCIEERQLQLTNNKQQKITQQKHCTQTENKFYSSRLHSVSSPEILWFGSIFLLREPIGSQFSNYPMRAPSVPVVGLPALRHFYPCSLCFVLFCFVLFWFCLTAFIHLMPAHFDRGAPVPESKSDVPSGLKPRRRRSSEQAPSLAISLRLFL